MKKVSLVFRKKSSFFNSIENVFENLAPYFQHYRLDLPCESIGLLNRFKNIRFLIQQKYSTIHITGHDHYLLWLPFKNTVLTIHDIEALKRKSGLKKWIFKKLWFDIPIKNAKAITTISEFSRTEILSLGNYKTPVTVIHNPLTLPLEYSPKEFNAEVTKILHLGAKKNKNLARTIMALTGLSCHLTIIGQPNSEVLELLKVNSISYTLKSNLTQVEIMEEYKKCDLVSFVSTYEGFGLPILEAQAVGRPVITSNVSSMPEVAGNGAYLVNPFSIEAIRAGLVKLIESNSLRNELIIEGLNNVSRFKPEIIANQYKKLYNQLVE